MKKYHLIRVQNKSFGQLLILKNCTMKLSKFLEKILKMQLLRLINVLLVNTKKKAVA
jgi:hypothetical protein